MEDKTEFENIVSFINLHCFQRSRLQWTLTQVHVNFDDCRTSDMCCNLGYLSPSWTTGECMTLKVWRLEMEISQDQRARSQC